MFSSINALPTFSIPNSPRSIVFDFVAYCYIMVMKCVWTSINSLLALILVLFHVTPRYEREG